MREKIRFFLRQPLISGGSIIFLSSFIGNIFNYVFNFSMGRFLSVSDYGALIALSSFVSLFSIFQVSVSGVFAKFSARYSARQDVGSQKKITLFGFKLVFLIGAIIVILLFIMNKYLTPFLNVENNVLMYLIYGSIFFSILISLPQGIFQGQMRFWLISFLSNITPFVKCILGITLVLLGIKLIGALSALFFSIFLPAVAALLILFFGLKTSSANRENKEEEKFKKEFVKYGSGFFVASLGMTLLSNTDIILVRHFFSAFTSGQYAALSLMGKAIFFFTAPISFVFFPMAAYKKEKKERLFGTFILALLLTLFISLVISIFYFVFPQIVLQVFFPGEGYKGLASYLGPFSLYIIIFSLANLLNSFLLSVGRVNIYKATILISLLQILLIAIFHKSLYQIIFVLSLVSFLLLVFFFIYYAKYEKD